MADGKIHLELVSPERLLLAADVDMVTVPGTEGDFGVLAGHAPVISSLRHGVVAVKVEGEPDERLFIRGGFAEVTPEKVVLLAEHAVPLGEVDRAALETEIRNARDDIQDAQDEATRAGAEARLAGLLELQTALAGSP